MFLPFFLWHSGHSSFPHSRGDVPKSGGTPCAAGVFSPLAWGCSVSRVMLLPLTEVFPTRVGMFRDLQTWRLSKMSFPHSRGDVPTGRAVQGILLPFSPLAWGCSAASALSTPVSRVFPTRVGMFRGQTQGRQVCLRFPHSRGDVPSIVSVISSSMSFSPLAWGCSDPHADVVGTGEVFPTRVGMFRPGFLRRASGLGFPHSRGDVPSDDGRISWRATFSPLAWGCSGTVLESCRASAVFPTRVGMFRASGRASTRRACFPHSRGDVPNSLRAAVPPCEFSPLAWGCSGSCRWRRTVDNVFPTRVGMFRSS